MALKDQSDWEMNMSAIADYFNRTDPKTSKARKIKDEFASWYNAIGWYDKYVNGQETYDKARRYRDQFNDANATTATEKEAIKRVKKTGVTSEQLRGEMSRARTSKGYIAEPEDEGFLTPKGKVALMLALAAAGGGIWLYLGGGGILLTLLSRAKSKVAGEGEKMHSSVKENFPHATEEAEGFLRQAIKLSKDLSSEGSDAVNRAILKTEASRSPQEYLHRAKNAWATAMDWASAEKTIKPPEITI